MNSFKAIPKGRDVLLTAPVIIYGICAKKPSVTMPLSPQCNILLDCCRTGYYQGVVTTRVIERCWMIIERLRQWIDNVEADPPTGALRNRFARKDLGQVPKRISALFEGELEVIGTEKTDFARAAKLSQEWKLPPTLALDIAAAERTTNGDTLVVALAGIDGDRVQYPSVHVANDLPWHGVQPFTRTT